MVHHHHTDYYRSACERWKMKIIHHLHRMRIQYGYATVIFLRDTAIVVVVILAISKISEWLARYYPIG